MKSQSRARLAATAIIAATALAAAVLSPVGAASAAAPVDDIANDTVWKDTNDQEIKAQGGNVLKVGDLYYWVGMSMDPRDDDAKQAATASIRLYRSPDLENWDFVKTLVTQWDNDLNNDGAADVDVSQSGILVADEKADLHALAIDKWLGRPQLVQHPDGRLILVAEVSGGRKNVHDKSLGNAMAFFQSTGTDIEGDYVYQGKQYMDVVDGSAGLTRGDGTLFVDGANAYMVYVGDSATSRNAEGIRVAPLSADWLTIMPHVYDDPKVLYEAPSIIKRKSTYYMFASGKYWWDATDTYYRTSTTPTGWTDTWKKMATNPAVEVPWDAVKSFGTQFAQVFPVSETDDTTYLYAGDRYSQYYSGTSPAPAGIGRNGWYPLVFDPTGVPKLHGATDVEIDAAAGTLSWNPVANGRFSQGDAFDAFQQAPPKVTDVKYYVSSNEYQFVPRWAVSGDTAAVKVQDRTDSTKDRQLKLDAPTAFATSVAQTIDLPNGNYRISFDTKSSGGFNSAYLFIKNHGSADATTTINTASWSWRTVTVDFTVTSNKVRFGFWADSPGAKWLALDNVVISKR